MFLILALACSNSNAQSNKLELKISSEKKSMTFLDSLFIKVEIINHSKKPIWIPKNFTFTSDIYPNPKEQMIQGGNVHFNIKPMDGFGSIYVEGIVFISEVSLQKIKPNKSVVCTYNFGYHISDYFPLLKPEELPSQIELTAEYNFDRKIEGSKSFRGKLKSNTITLSVEL